MVQAKVYTYVKEFEGEPKASDIQLSEENLPAIKDNEFLVEAEYLSVDPYMRAHKEFLKVNKTMIGSQVGRIVESKNPKYPVGKKVIGYFGWRTHTIVQPTTSTHMFERVHLLPDFGDLPSSLALGVLGMPGNSAYFGFLEICKPQAGETLVVSGAAGAVGSHVGQIGKNVIGMRVIGIAGSDAKCKWLVEELGFDVAINYKTENIATALKKAAPKGVDCYFDNVGGEISTAVIYQMNNFGRVSICGCISNYNADPSTLPKATPLQPVILFKQLKVEGFLVNRWEDRWMEGIMKNLEWIQEGKLKYQETITNGFENMFNAFVGLFKGENTGKAIIKV